jgi:hypothetical protein
MRNIIIKAALAASVLTFGSAAAQSKTRGWFVVAGAQSFNDSTPNRNMNEERVRAAASRCGLYAYTRYGQDMDNMKAGQMVQIVGGYATRSRAEAALAAIRPCLKGAYIRKSIDRFSESEY